MILIYPERLGSVSASSEDGAFPAENLLDSKPKKIWRSQSTTAILTAIVSAHSSQIGLFNTNASSAVVSIKIGGVEQESFSINLDSPHSKNRLWQSYTEQLVTHTVEITLTASGSSAVYAGVLIIGDSVEVLNPEYGASESRRDFSIIKELNNGAYYIRKRDSVRKFNVSFLVDRSSGYCEFTEVADHYGPSPLAVLIADGIGDDSEWGIYGHIINPFSGNHAYYSHSKISYEITEAV